MIQINNNCFKTLHLRTAWWWSTIVFFTKMNKIFLGYFILYMLFFKLKRLFFRVTLPIYQLKQKHCGALQRGTSLHPNVTKRKTTGHLSKSAKLWMIVCIDNCKEGIHTRKITRLTQKCRHPYQIQSRNCHVFLHVLKSMKA